MTRHKLRAAARRAHATGERFASWWQRHAADVAEIEPYDRAASHRLEAELLSLVTSGDMAGMFAAGDDDARAPWEADDRQHVDESYTAARAPLELRQQTMFAVATG